MKRLPAYVLHGNVYELRLTVAPRDPPMVRRLSLWQRVARRLAREPRPILNWPRSQRIERTLKRIK